ncbi:hypothetical protein [Bacillus andreraoultii]|uniref:hypothetical protein n=1 Tax=Bacillus andreraoultii TaxID=1499685 RepID=UPI0012B55BA7|nr:hypothetical protein [Bacillus andreraoultii]
MNLKSFLPAFLAGYLLCMLIVFLVFDFFSLSFVLGSLVGIALFSVIVTIVKNQTK